MNCSLCTTPSGTSAEDPLPTFWSQITIAEKGNAIRNFTLCLSCTAAVRAKMGALNSAYRDSLVKK